MEWIEERQMITHALMRYERFLTLRAKYPDAIMSMFLFFFLPLPKIHTALLLIPHSVPTSDLLLAWTTHMLRPHLYEADCKRLFGEVYCFS